jgi:iron uptake system EfeUOB component EfeO/EfeM
VTLSAGGAVFTCIAALLALTALGVGGGSTPDAVARPQPPQTLTPLQAYSEHAAERSGAAGVGGAPPAPELVPLPAAAFNAPIAAYRVYAAHQLGAMAAPLTRLRVALRAGRRSAARAAWEAAYSDYLHLGAVYGEFGTLDKAIDGNPGGLPGGAHDPHFTGLHRLELGLWGEAGSPRQLLGAADQLTADVDLLRRRLPGEQITPLEYATRTHEILEDAIRDLLSGVDVPWSHAGVLATAAGVYATHELLSTLRPLLDGRENAIEVVESALVRLDRVLAALRGSHHGHWPTLEELGLREAETLNGAVGGAAEALDQVPGALETKLPPPIPPLPRSR